MSAVQSQPGAETVAAFEAAMGQEPQTPEVVQTSAAPASTPTEPMPSPAPPPSFDPATIRIPETAQLPKHAEKYKGKSLAEVIELDHRTQQWAGEKAQEAARLARENAELQARLAAAEQVRSMLPQTPQAPPDPWQGVNPDEAIFTNPRGVLDTTLTMAEQRARAVAQEEARKAQEAVQAEFQKREYAARAVQTFEAAKAKIRQSGYDISDDGWVQALGYIAPIVDGENRVSPGIAFNPDRYVEHFVALRGGPAKPTIPQEGNPPVSASPKAAPSSEKPVPSLSREQRQLAEVVTAAFVGKGVMTPDQAAAFARGEGWNR